MKEQNTSKDTNESSTSSVLSRSAQILQAASPFLDESTKQTLESVVHVTDFLDTIQNFRKNGISSMFSGLFGNRSTKGDTVSMANLSQTAPPLDTESILKSIRPFCTSDEGALIDRLMNIFSMQKFFKMYQTMQSMMSMMNMSAETGQQSTDTEAPIQTDSEEINDTTTFYNTYWNSFQDQDDGNSNFDNHCNGNNYYDSTPNDYNYTQNTNGSTSSADNISSTNTTSTTNNMQMLEMFSSIIPPEQKSTFETMKLLIESGMLK